MSKYVGFRLGKVHESHVISEYYCGGCGWPVTDHDSFCPECGGAFRECDASNLEAENAKLREYVTKLETANLDVTARLTDYIGQYDPTDAFVVEVKAQNTKLRGDVERMFNANVKKNGEITRLLNENEKLRDLVRDMWDVALHPHLFGDGSYLLRRMCDLGIEVG